MPPRNARSAGNRRYYDWHGERYWSVTTITKGGLPASYGLRKWQETAVAKAAVSAVQDGTLVPMVERSPEGAVEYLAQVPYTSRGKAADLGTVIHDAIEARVVGRPAAAPPPEALPYLEQFERFVDEYGVTFEQAEASVYNRRHAYAGTLDSIVRMAGMADDLPSILLDVKTGSGVYAEVALQMAAYRNAEFIGGADDREYPMPATGEIGLVLHLQPTWYEPHAVDLSDDVFRAFLYARETYRWDLVTSRNVLRGRFLKPGQETAEQVSLFTPDAAEAAGVSLPEDDDRRTS